MSAPPRAIISDDRRYRYALWRRLGAALDQPERTVLFVMLNPSTADANIDDNTIRRCIRFTRDWGYSTLAVGNLFAYRATKPRQLRAVSDPVGAMNMSWLRKLRAEADMVIAAWGSDPIVHRDKEHVAKVRAVLGSNVKILSLNKDGTPEHPLYAPRVTIPMVWGGSEPEED